MATLNSPGVSVTVIDESFYTPAAPGTTPLIVIASAENKLNGSSTGTAPGTLKTNAGQVYLLTSQKDLADTFGTPVFKTDANNNPIHAGEQNEYGLQAAYSYLGVSNRAYVVRADMDLDQLTATPTAPAGEPTDGTLWFDTANTLFGIFQWNSAASTVPTGQSFINKVPTVITDKNKLVGSDVLGAPLSAVGSIGDYAVVATTSLSKLYYKKPLTYTAAGTWVQVGSADWAASWPTVQSATDLTGAANEDTLVVNGQSFTGLLTIEGAVTAINNSASLTAAGVKAAKINNRLEIYSTGVAIVLSGTTATKLGLDDFIGMDFLAPTTNIKPHYQVPLFKKIDFNTSDVVNGRPTGSIWIKTTSPNLGADWIVKKYSTAAKAWQLNSAPLFVNSAAALASLDVTGGGTNLPAGTLYVKANDYAEYSAQGATPFASFKIYKRVSGATTRISSQALSASATTYFGSGSTTFEFEVSVTNKGIASFSTPVTVTVAATSNNDLANALKFVQAFDQLGLDNITVELDTANKINIIHKEAGDIKIIDTDGLIEDSGLFPVNAGNNLFLDPEDTTGPQKLVASLWTSSLSLSESGGAFQQDTAPSSTPIDGTLWYNSLVDEVDIMIHNGTYWVGYQNYPWLSQGLPKPWAGGPIVGATRPKLNPDGGPLQIGDLWIDTSDLENYPKLYKRTTGSGSGGKWVLVDAADQTTENGILFADARWGVDGGTTDNPTNSTIEQLLLNDFLDFDAPDPALYPRGMLLWNTRRSGFNVKKYVTDYVDTAERNLRYNGISGQADTIGEGQSMVSYYPNRWISAAANQENGAGTFGRKAQRKVVVQALQALVNSNQVIRDEESRVFNLLSCPGYPELISELVNLNIDRGQTAFVVGDAPARLASDATTLTNWGNNLAGAVEDGDTGLVTSDEYLGVFYPWGFSSDNLGNNVVVPPSHMMLRTIALSDNVSYPWFAPAGTRRGGITNASAVGYVNAQSGEFQSVALNTGQRDTLAAIKVNPITFITGTGLINYGQYTRAKNASALDRINVARLVIYLRRQFTQLSKPYVFEPNDKITRDELKGAAESLLLELVGQRALYDYIVVCDTSNNTPSRIDRNELYLDVAIEPVKSVEFIYIPLRLKNTGEIKALGN